MPLWKVTVWDKKFNTVSKCKQERTIKYHYLLAADLAERVVDGGDIKVLTTYPSDLWTTEEKVGDIVSEGEIVSIPWGGNPNVQYYKGRFVTADNRIATSADTSVLNNKYLYYFMLGNQVQIGSFYRGASLKHPEMGKVLDMELPLPPLPTQRAIAEELDRICELKRTAEKLVEKYRLLIKAKFSEMFGDVVANTKNWRISSLGDHVRFMTSGSRGWAKYYSSEGELFITIKNVKNNRIRFSEVQYVKPPVGAEADRTRVQSGDVLVSITADLGRTGVVTDEIANRGAYINQHLMRIQLMPESLDSMFLSYYLESPGGRLQFEVKNNSAVKAGLNFESIRSLRVPLPPLALQREFAAFVEKVEKLEQAAKETVEEYDLLYRSKLQEYFG